MRVTETTLTVLNSPHPQTWRSQMAIIANTLSRVTGTQVDIETLKTIAIFCGVGLFASLTAASYGLDLSGGLF
jgi:hypothetical protein